MWVSWMGEGIVVVDGGLGVWEDCERDVGGVIDLVKEVREVVDGGMSDESLGRLLGRPILMMEGMLWMGELVVVVEDGRSSAGRQDRQKWLQLVHIAKN